MILLKEKNVFVITGPCGVGKSTASRRLAQTLDKSCHINANLIYEMVVGRYLFPWQEVLKYIVLMADENTVRMRDGKRPPQEVMGDRAIEVFNEFKDKKKLTANIFLIRLARVLRILF